MNSTEHTQKLSVMKPEELKDFWNKRYPYNGEPFYDWIGDIVDLIKPKKVVEVGCGSGVWAKCFEDYTGYDFAEDRIKGKKNLLYGDIVDGIDDKADLVFASVVFLHIRPQDIEKALENFLKISKNFIIIEPITYRTRTKGRHVFHHDYFRLLPNAELWRVERYKDEDLGVLVGFEDQALIAKNQLAIREKGKEYDKQSR